MMLSKKHYKAIAEIINGGRPDKGGDYESGYNNSRRDIAYHLADYFAADNPRCEKTNTGFDRDRFMKACGL